MIRFEREYQIIRELGRGGEGRVYLVRHVMTEQLRAAKRLAKEKEDDRLHELDMLKKLHHPSLPEVIDVLLEEDCVWLILTYIRGKNLQMVAEEGIGEEQFFSIAEQLIGVIRYLHEREAPILHLDIKPTNLLLKKDGTLVLIDFGAAVRGHPDARMDRCCGTPGFAAPEQYKKRHSLDTRTDIYGIGAVLYYLLHGETCSEEDDSQMSVRNTGCGRCKKRYANRQLNRILQRCLRTHMEERYSQCSELLEAFDQAHRKRKKRDRRRKAFGGVLLLCVCLLFALQSFFYESLQHKISTEEQYEHLIRLGDGRGIIQAQEPYLEAAELCPEKEELYFHVLKRMLEDMQLSQQEEEILQKLFYHVIPGSQDTLLESMAKREKRYGELMYRVGLSYWYYYEGEGGKTAAKHWFDFAVQSIKRDGNEAEKQKSRTNEGYEWEESAYIYARVAGYYTATGENALSGTQEMDYPALWTDLNQLWSEPGFQREQIDIKIHAARELLSCAVMGMAALLRDGENGRDIRESLLKLRSFSEQKAIEEEARKGLKEQYRNAVAAFDRVYGREKNGE